MADSGTGIGRGAPAGGRSGRIPVLLGRVRWFCRELFGDAKYDRYVAHLRRAHPEAPVPDRRAFWREHYAEQDRNPGARCC